MSWLLVAGVPALLMLAALGLGRLESELAPDALAVADVDEFLERAGGVDMHTLASEGMPEALEYLHRREIQQLAEAPANGRGGGPRHAAPSFAIGFVDRDELTLPTRIHGHSHVNPQFKAPRHANRV
ncbi:hypothetical protein A5687_19930 [Mycobacterium mantenii]|uniref:Uncharacterized protein n=1 Tax=Mycobacterium mantenii TaxID=560555 RepID=A0A1A2TN01_MYCNT|nr:hypothetical protein A5688_14230 [Mycobacterium mantenii]OBH59788.1 hypothetical protein A5687_19930 [Mycobacterium mantenii]OBH77750.1 hypothetical protein A5683_18205 [Mycobacterium mantenii]